jgi:GNAT superfamily N-acetyltransferase
VDEVLRAAAGNCASAYVVWAEAMDRPAARADDVWFADLKAPVPAPPNNATLVRPFDGAADALVDRLTTFFVGPGGGYQVWDLWGSLDLSAHGFGHGRAPCMVRDPGPAADAPPELSVERAADAAALLEAEDVTGSVFGARAVTPGYTLGEGLLGSDELVIWVGRVDGRAVATSFAHVACGMLGVYAVAVLPDARRRGYGEALTWAATSYRPDLPATLQASSMGLPVYERMGYRTIGTFDIWQRDER